MTKNVPMKKHFSELKAQRFVFWFFFDSRCVLMKYNCFHSGKQTLKIFDGNDAVKRNQFRLISVPRIAKNEEVVVRYPVRVNFPV